MCTIPVKSMPPSEAVIYRIASCEGVDPLELRPLYQAIDPDALDSLVYDSATSGTTLQVEFTYLGYDITVMGDGVVHVDERPDVSVASEKSSVRTRL